MFRAPRRGFDAFVGNPPWVSYAGRASQPLEDERRRFFDAFYDGFAGYKNLQGLFIERCAKLLAPGGRLGLVIPSSMSEQGGYGPTRTAHDRLCECDDDLPDLGEDAFGGVFQPCMVLRSTRRRAPLASPGADAAPWPVERPDLDAEARAMVRKMTAGPRLPPHLFGERGVQTSGDDMDHVARVAGADHTVPLRTGGDIQAFRRAAPSFFAEPRWFGPRLRTPEEWRNVRIPDSPDRARAHRDPVGQEAASRELDPRGLRGRWPRTRRPFSSLT